ncbi:MAG: type II secretion system protein [Planctomycetes bacterium]|nr:type II secretion system protein [Planctomycetota bacterium]
MERESPTRLSLVEVMVAICFLGILALVAPVLLQGTRPHRHHSDCKNNLKQLSNYLTLYVSRYGGDRHYPTTVAVGGSGAPVPAGLNGAFWSWLYRIPNAMNAVSQRPGDDGLYVCKMSSTVPTPTALEYTAPNFGAKWPPTPQGTPAQPVFPGGKLSEAVRGDAMIGGDLIGPPDLPNHSGQPGVPDDDWNILFFDGHVEAVVPDSVKHSLYSTMTTGVRTT